MHTCKHYNTWITSHVQLGIRTKPSRRTAHEMLVRHQAILARDVLHALHDLVIISSSHKNMHHDHNWLAVSTPLKNMKVIWDDDIPNIWKNKNVPNPQPAVYF